jgi:protocatechuate 3,4-dioxygenase beta subunit
MTTPASERTEDKPKRPKSRAALAFLFVLCAAASAFAQTTATVEGRVTGGDKGVAGVLVIMTRSNQPARSTGSLRAKTDAEGRYRIANVPPGSYQVLPFAPAYVIEGAGDPSMGPYQQGKSLTLSAGDTADNVDFRIERGGVITGHITDADGDPVVAQQVTIWTTDNGPGGGPRVVGINAVGNAINLDPRAHMTDDRGVYRIYGLPAGRYHVSTGSDTANGAVSYGRRKLYQRTFYPGVNDESQAEAVEVSAGGEAANVDIKLGTPVKTYKASGSFVDAATGQPTPNVAFGFGAVDPATRHITGSFGLAATDANGEFVADGLAPGHYAVFARQPPSDLQSGAGANDFYSDPTYFDVVDSDVKGLVVTLKHGATLDGVLTVEGSNDRATVARVASQLRIYAYYTGDQAARTMSNIMPSPVAPDGSFHLSSLRPGTLRIMTASGNVTLLRVELNGANVTNGVEVTEGAQVSGVRVVVAYGNAVIRGQVNYLNGTPPQNAQVFAFAHRTGGEPNNRRAYQVDARGHFVIEGLAAGEYDVTVRVFGMNVNQFPTSNSQHVSLADGGEATVSLTLDLGAQPEGVKP